MFEITLVNMRDGSVQGHKAGCADLKRNRNFVLDNDPWTFTVEDCAQAWLEYNVDFLAEGGEDNAYDIDWKPCANHVPTGDTHARYLAAF